MAAKIDLTGMRFGRLVVISGGGSNKEGRALWVCNCDCGSEKLALGKTLLSGKTRSCGCLHRESSMRNIPKTTKPLSSERTTRSGYIEIKTERGYVRKHIHVMECHLGRRLTKDEVVHHIDQDKRNNDLSNLQLMTNAEHTALHNRLDPVSKETCRKIAIANLKYPIEVARLVRSLIAEGMSQRQAAIKAGVSPTIASRIARNLTYTE